VHPPPGDRVVGANARAGSRPYARGGAGAPLDPSLVDDLREVLLAATLYDDRRRHEGGPPNDELRAAIDRLGAAVFAPGSDQRERRAS
jgi:hypothetical protein